MKFTQYHSGSSGNLYIVESDSGKRLMIECGVPYKKIIEAFGHDLSNIDACVVSHKHRDHCKAMNEVLKAGIDIYASKETLESMDLLNHRRTFEVENNTLIDQVEGFQVLCFSTVHDDLEGALGFVVRDKEVNEFLLFATDTAYITQQFKVPFKIIAVEASYDKARLEERVESGDINESLAKRLLDSHMEWRNTLDYILRFCDRSKCQEIHLLHLSGDNLNKKHVRKAVQDETFIDTFTVKKQKQEAI